MQLIKEQIEQFESFISKLPISKVRSDIERIWEAVKNKGYNMRSEQMNKLREYSVHIEDSSLQSFIQSFEHWVKNVDGSKSPVKEATKEIPKANLGDGVANSIKKSKVVDKNTSDNSVSPYDDNTNNSSKKQLDKKEEEKKVVRENAKDTGIKRTVSGMQNHDTAPKEKQKTGFFEKLPHKNNKK